MANSRYWTILGFVLAAVLVIATGRWAVNHSGAQLKSGTTYPTAEELDLLARYLKPVPASALPVVDAQPIPVEDDPFDLRNFGPDESEAPDTPQAPAGPRWAVSAILISEARRIAVINDAVVSIGAQLAGGARLIEIQRDHVVIQESGGVRRVLSLLASR